MSISHKKREALYNVVHEEVMNARVKISLLYKNNADTPIEIDNILSELCQKAPQKAIEIFNIKQKRKTK